MFAKLQDPTCVLNQYLSLMFNVMVMCIQLKNKNLNVELMVHFWILSQTDKRVRKVGMGGRVCES